MRVRKHLTYANVAATIALFGVVAGGGAYAASKIGTADIQSHAVTRPKLDAKAVSSGKIADGAVGNAQLSSDTDGVAMMGLTYDRGLVVSYFNRAGDGVPRVERTSTGTFAIYFPGVDYALAPFVEVATTLNGGRATITHDSCSGYCPPTHPVVTTRNDAGNLGDASFTYVAFRGATP